MSQKQRVLVTGAAGVIGQAFIRHYKDVYDISGLDLKDADNVPTTIANIDDLDAILPAFEGIDAVVHLAASISVDSPWDAVLHANLIGTYNVFEAARRSGVGCVVFASSNHAIGGYEVEGAPSIYEKSDPRVYDETVAIRPDSLYGVSKAYGGRSAATTPTPSACASTACGSAPSAPTTTRAILPWRTARSGSI
jgi:nucleoside-diphosphate-sugar epimerase